MEPHLPVSKEIVAAVSRLDRFQGIWSSGQIVRAERLPTLREAATVQAVASSCRLAGIRVSDIDVASLLRDGTGSIREARELLGYAAALNLPLPGSAGRLLTAEDLGRVHGLMLGTSASANCPLPWRREPLYREAFDVDGRATGRVFATLPPRMVEAKTEELLTWLEFELRSNQQHPALVVGAFMLLFLAISPFEKGNGRMSRLLGTQLLVRAGYTFAPYASLEAQFEAMRDEYYSAIHRSLRGIWTPAADLSAFLECFMLAVSQHRERVETKVALERQVLDYPPLQRAILETVREHGNVDAALLIKATGANRNTLKDNLRRLVHRGVLEKTGQRRGTRYRMAAGDGVQRPSEGVADR